MYISRQWYLIAMLAMANLLPSPATAEEAPPNLESIIARIEENEHLLQNIEIQGFKLVLQSLPPKATVWETSKYTISGNAWYNGSRNSKARIQIDQQVMEWRNGRAPWLERQLDVGYDGQFGRVVHRRNGVLGNPHADNSAELIPDRPQPLTDRYQGFADGTVFSLNFYRPFDGSDQTLSQELKVYAQRAAKAGLKSTFEISWDDLYGGRMLRLLNGDLAQAHLAFWLDPSRGYALRKAESVGLLDAGERLVYRLEVSEVQLAGPGIWFPTRGSREEPQPGKSATQMKASFQSAKVIANNPAFDEAIFTVPFPARYWVTDRVGGTTFYTSDPKVTELALNNAVTSLRGRAAVAAATPSAAPAVVIPARAPRRSILWIAVIVLGILLAAAGLVLIVKRRRFAPVLFLAALHAASAVALAEMPTSRPAADAPQQNCGVNVSYFILKWFDREPDIFKVATQLNVGESFKRACSLKELGDLYAANGLTAGPFKGDSLGDVLGAIPQDSLAVVRVNMLVAGASVPHFVVLITQPDGFCLVDGAAPPQCLTTKDALAHSGLKKTTGEFLLVSRSNAEKRKGPAVEFPRKEIDLGRIPVGKNKFDAKVQFANVGTETLRILETRTTCNCMETPTGDTTLAPGAQGQISITFDRAKLTPGRNERAVLIVTNDPQNTNAKVTFKFELAVTALPTEPDVTPRAVDYGRSRAADVVARPLTFELRVPLEIPNAPAPDVRVEASTPLLRVQAIADAAEPGGQARNSGRTPGKVMRFEAKWSAAPRSRDIVESIIFLISQPGNEQRKLEIPIRGEVLSASTP